MAEERDIFTPEEGDAKLGEVKPVEAMGAEIETASTELPHAVQVGAPVGGISLSSEMQQKAQKAPNQSGTGTQEPTPTVLPAIIEKIHDPNFPLEEVNRLIAIEKSFIARELSGLNEQGRMGTSVEGFRLKGLEARLKAMDSLEKSLESTDLKRNRDILNMDGPKFQYVIGIMSEQMKVAILAVFGKNASASAQSVIKHWRDQMAVLEPSIRKEVDKIDSRK